MTHLYIIILKVTTHLTGVNGTSSVGYFMSGLIGKLQVHHVCSNVNKETI